jgi:tetratricopeptide (TPR) repeat protein
MAKREFKKGNYDTGTGIGAVTKHYYERTINSTYTDNTGDWLGRLCYQYALRIKESQGNKSALDIFTRALKALPDSFAIWREYYSHLGCMLLYDAPNEAFSYYSTIIAAFGNNKALCALPFHEYGDRAMSKLLEGNADWAAILAQEAIDICESNGIIDEWGRILNIKGCAFLCQGKPSQASLLFKESLELLKSSGYKLYSWRSQLNYIQLELNADNIRSELIDEFEDAYRCFVSLFKNKIKELVYGDLRELRKTREYHALLVIGLCLNSIKKQPSLINIFKDFELDAVKSTYQKDLWQLINDPEKALQKSPYYRAGKIIMIG